MELLMLAPTHHNDPRGGQMSSMYLNYLAEGDDPDAPERVQVEQRGDRALVTLAEPERRNVLSAALVRQLRRALEELVRGPELRTIVLTGADPGFSAGGDRRMMQTAIEHLGDAAGTTDIWRWIRHQ